MIDMLRNDKIIVDSFNITEIENNNEFLKIKLVRRFIPLPYNNKI